jgi:hypothetical protein
MPAIAMGDQPMIGASSVVAARCDMGQGQVGGDLTRLAVAAAAFLVDCPADALAAIAPSLLACEETIQHHT